jgi:hypothetical protein
MWGFGAPQGRCELQMCGTANLPVPSCSICLWLSGVDSPSLLFLVITSVLQQWFGWERIGHKSVGVQYTQLPLRLVDLKMCFESTGGKSWQIPKDCEGFGSTESDKTRDAKLMSLCMLFLGLVNGAPTCIYIYTVYGLIWIKWSAQAFFGLSAQHQGKHTADTATLISWYFVILVGSCWRLRGW